MPVIGGRNPNAWNNWYHCVGGTYGTWLHGDPRGFRTYHHRQHVEGDYRNPPPKGEYDELFRASKEKLKYPPVLLTNEQRRIICDAMIEKLRLNRVEVISLAIAANHFHLLARFPLIQAERGASASGLSHSLIRDGRDPAPRHFLGLARKHASFELRARGLKPQSPVWGARPKATPVKDRDHQVALTHYIMGHESQGAAVWSMFQQE